MAIETDPKFRRPGVVLLITGILFIVAQSLVGWIPFIGGLMSVILVLAGVFMILGGLFLLITKRST